MWSCPLLLGHLDTCPRSICTNKRCCDYAKGRLIRRQVPIPPMSGFKAWMTQWTKYAGTSKTISDLWQAPQGGEVCQSGRMGGHESLCHDPPRVL